MVAREETPYDNGIDISEVPLDQMTPEEKAGIMFPAISSSVVPFFSHLQLFPASGSFQTNQFFTTGAQSIGVSISISFLPKNIQD